jgi:hypothetical protein
MTTRLSDEEVWNRAFNATMQGCMTADGSVRESVCRDSADRALKSFRERFPLNIDLPGPTVQLRGINLKTVELLVAALRERGRSDAAGVVEAMFRHINENNGLSPEWVPPGRGG